MIGNKYSRLTILRDGPGVKRKGNGIRKNYICQCECGEIKIVDKYHLLSGKIKSCGCYQEESRKITKTIHGQAGSDATREYRSWSSMKERCLNSNCKSFKNYGGRGIGICEKWINSFEEFYKDMGPSSGLTIDRIDNNLGYYKENCRWASKKEQAINRRTTDFIEFNGITLNQKEWSEKLGIQFKTLNRRIRYLNWPIEKALTTPTRQVFNCK